MKSPVVYHVLLAIPSQTVMMRSLKTPTEGASIDDARIELKKIMTWAYVLHAEEVDIDGITIFVIAVLIANEKGGDCPKSSIALPLAWKKSNGSNGKKNQTQPLVA